MALRLPSGERVDVHRNAAGLSERSGKQRFSGSWSAAYEDTSIHISP
jgi:hypothetical protein